MQTCCEKGASPPPMEKSLGTNEPHLPTTAFGFRRPEALNTGPHSDPTTLGLHMAPSLTLAWIESEIRQSSSAAASTAEFQRR